MKDVFNRHNIQLCGEHLAKLDTQFDLVQFIKVATDQLEQRELKDRANQIYLALVQTLPKDFSKAADLLLDSLVPVKDNQDLTDITTNEQGVAGWMILPYSQFIGEQGQDDLAIAMSALKEMTKRFSSEFGIRYLYLTQPQQSLEIALHWVTDPCHHVRRLVSEGCRPLLPWAMQLPEFKAKPDTIRPLLEALKDDESEYVRRSVANNINDIAKDHPEWVVSLVENWFEGASPNRIKLIKHACRTLIKQGHPSVLSLFGYGDASQFDVALSLQSNVVDMGNSLGLQADIKNTSDQDSKVLLDYVVYHLKANGKLAPKVFKWKSFDLAPNAQIRLEKLHPFKVITTRKYYQGHHQIALQVNGQIQAAEDFELRL